MRVLNPGPGEVVDRLTIVARKVVETTGEQKKQFEAEMDELTNYFGQQLQALNTDRELVVKFVDWLMLAAVNAALWQREDRVREFRNGRPPGTTDFSQLSFQIQYLNDQRNGLVKQINVDAGVVREEKL